MANTGMLPQKQRLYSLRYTYRNHNTLQNILGSRGYKTIATTTLTSHGPFDLPDEYKMLELPQEIDNSYLGGYIKSINYTDRQIGEFIDNPEKSGVMKDSVLVIYGDHAGLNKYENYKESLKYLDYEDNFWKSNEVKVLSLIYNIDLQGETTKTYGGLIDVLPTISYLMRINREEFDNKVMAWMLLYHLLFTNSIHLIFDDYLTMKYG